jgi:hypothetical protein
MVASLIVFACGRSPLRVKQHERSIVLDMQSFGEYASDVARLQVIDASRK